MAVDMELVKAWALKGALYTLVSYIGFWVWILFVVCVLAITRLPPLLPALPAIADGQPAWKYS